MSGTQNVSDFVQKYFVSATNVSQFAQPKKHHEQQCVRNNVSSFASTLTLGKNQKRGIYKSNPYNKEKERLCVLVFFIRTRSLHIHPARRVVA